MFLVLLLLLSFLLAYYLWCRRELYMLAWKCRGPLGLPFIGISLSMKNPEELMRTLCNLKLHYKPPLTFWIGTRCFLYIDDADSMQDILNAKECSDKSVSFDVAKAVLGESILTSKYDKWMRFKKLFTSCFSHNVLLTFFKIFNDNASNISKAFDKKIDKGPFDLREIVARTVLDVALETMCGVDLAFTENDSKNLLTAITGQIELCVIRMYQPWLANDWIYRLTKFHKMQTQYRELFMSTLFNLVNGRIKIKEEEDKDYQETKSGIFLSKALELENKGELTQQELQDNTLTFIVASFETSSSHLFLTLVCLAMYPEYQDKLIEELAENLPADPEAEISYENIKDLKYLNMVFNESLRLMPSLPLVARDVTCDITLRNGITIPKGAQVLLSVFNAHRNKDIWGDKADQFNPDHCHPDNLAKLHPYAYVPFFKGVRTCIGSKYAMMMSKVFLCRIFRKYRFRTDTKMEDLQYMDHISLKIQNPCLVEVLKI